MQKSRYLEGPVKDWLKQRAVFVGGPRQVGKTCLAKKFIDEKRSYLSWDDPADRVIIKKNQWHSGKGTYVLDEIHKYPRWRALVKTLFDKNFPDIKMIVAGSARLDYFRKGGDSLFGRYHYFRLHPFTVSEVDKKPNAETALALLQFGGFPEPFLKQNESFAKIWRRERAERVIHQDLRDLTQLKDYLSLELLADALPDRVGSLLSLNSLGEDLEKSPHTIQNWIEILGSVYFCFTIVPFGPAKIKAIKKSRKLYLWDWSAVADRGARFENMVASHLYKYCHYIEDTQGDKMELRYLKDQFGREIDFVVIKNRKPLFAVECKTGDRNVSRGIEYYYDRTNIPQFYQVHLGEKSYTSGRTRVLPFHEFCGEVNLV